MIKKLFWVILFLALLWLASQPSKTTIIFPAKAQEHKKQELSSVAQEPKEKKPETIEDIITRTAQENNFDNIALLIRIAKCESSLNPKAKNPNSSARGLFQILDMHKLSIEERQNPETSTKWAINRIKQEGSPRAWKESENCWK
jgi:U3 small nucleolar ribonucleoprotein component